VGAGVAPGATPDLLIEVPHGATRRRHYDALRRRLHGDSLPEDLEAFFFVNTDVGSFETARRTAELVTEPETSPELADLLGENLAAVGELPPRSVLVVRSLVPRTFIDCNRVLGTKPPAGGALTPGLPGYIDDPRDEELLRSCHGQYTAAATKAFETVCGAGRAALILHTYAPRSISGIVETLRSAYAADRYESWPRRPAVDVIGELTDGTGAAPRSLVETLKRFYARIGVDVAENATYRLDPATMGHVHSLRYPGRVLCMEISRDLLADPFTPFEEMRIGEEKTERMATPIAAAVLTEMARSEERIG
jgi:hypothetical protein